MYVFGGFAGFLVLVFCMGWHNIGFVVWVCRGVSLWVGLVGGVVVLLWVMALFPCLRAGVFVVFVF